MPRNVFFSFHYQRDIFRVNQIRNIPNICSESAAGFRDASLWEEARSKGDNVIKDMIDRGLEGTSVTVVCIGAATAGRKFINYEIEKSAARRNGLLGLRIHNLIGHGRYSDVAGSVPPLLTRYDAPIYTYTNHSDLSGWIEWAALKAGR